MSPHPPQQLHLRLVWGQLLPQGLQHVSDVRHRDEPVALPVHSR